MIYIYSYSYVLFSRYQLAVVNSIDVDTQCNNLMPGEDLCLGWQGEDCDTTYVVQPNDDCDLITGMAGINDTILYLNNPQINSDCTNIYIGEVRNVSLFVFPSFFLFLNFNSVFIY